MRASVNFESCKKLTDDAVTALAQNCSQLTSVNFAGCDKLTDAAVTALARARQKTGIDTPKGED